MYADDLRSILVSLCSAFGGLDLPKSAAYQFTIARFDALAMGGILALAVRDKYYLNLA